MPRRGAPGPRRGRRARRRLAVAGAHSGPPRSPLPGQARPPSGECPLPGPPTPPRARRARAALFVRGGGAAHSRPCARCPCGQAAAQLPPSPGTALPGAAAATGVGRLPGVLHRGLERAPSRWGRGWGHARLAVGGAMLGYLGGREGEGWTLPIMNSEGVTWRSRDRGLVPFSRPHGVCGPGAPCSRAEPSEASIPRALSPGLRASPAYSRALLSPNALCWKPFVYARNRDAPGVCVCPFILLYMGCSGIANIQSYGGVQKADVTFPTKSHLAHLASVRSSGAAFH